MWITQIEVDELHGQIAQLEARIAEEARALDQRQDELNQQRARLSASRVALQGIKGDLTNKLAQRRRQGSPV